uniref:Trafficking protein particle complex subunit 10 n=1 Tax=Cajanus cajan TaxID=3821 RepID=A0A151RBG2_CAJCA|nr:Trafficking protein particle complex subunit 10 [Cajanus cajan]
MANFLAQFQTIKNTSDRLVISVEDVSDIWPTVKPAFEARLPFKRATLNNKTRNPVFVEALPAEFILTTDSRLRSRFPHEQFLFWFREPYANIVLVTCEDLDEFKTILKPRLKLIVQNDEREWFVVFVSKAHPANDQASKMAKKVYAKLEVEFNTKKRERCCKYDMHLPEANFWEDLESKIMECIRNTLDRRVQFYEDEIRKLSEQRLMPVWNFCNFFILKESLAFMFEMAHLHEDALREYDELELCYLETVNVTGKQRDFGGADHGDDQAALVNPGNKALTQIVQEDSFREFEFRQYLFACQSKLLFKLNRPIEAASRGYSFIISFSKSLALHERILPFCMREVWVTTACLALIEATTSNYKDELVAPDIEKEFFRLLGDLYSLARVKFMRLAYLIGYGTDIERSPVNSASLSLLPWPKPAVWPTVPADASTELILQTTSRTKSFGIQRKPLPLEPTVLLREANRRRASLSAGNMSEMFDSRQGPMEGSGFDSSTRMSPPRKALASSSMSRTNSSPGNFEGSIDRPMRLAEIFIAAEHALKQTISNPELWKSLSSSEEFERCLLILVLFGLALKSSTAIVLHPGRNTITLDLPPQKPGSYVLGVLTGQIGPLRFRSHSFSKVGPADSDDFMSYEKPAKPILKVFKPRALVDLDAAVSSALLINEDQWVGILVRPVNYSLKAAVLHIDTGPGLEIKESHVIEMESSAGVSENDGDQVQNDDAQIRTLNSDKKFERLILRDGKIEFPNWASEIPSILWVLVRAISDTLSRGSSSATTRRESIVDGMRTIALKLEFGAFHNQIFERTLAVHFTYPFYVRTRVTDKCNDGTLLLQVILHSEVKATLTIYDAWLDLQDGFVHTGQTEGRPNSSFFPLIISPSSKAGILFSICLDKTNLEEAREQPESILNIKYGISGDRTIGAHPPVMNESAGVDGARQELIFRSAITLQRPVLDPCLAVGFLPLPSDGLRVGQLIKMQWRVERLKDLDEAGVSKQNDEVLYEVNANSGNWMIAGRKRGYASLSPKQGARIIISVLCMPLVAGYVRPPLLGLPDVDEANISCKPAGPHLVCVLPPPLSSSFCIPVNS